MTAPEIQVRPIGISDLMRIRSMRTDILMSEHVNGPLGIRMPEFRAAMPFGRRGRRSFVAQLDGRLLGVIDMIADPTNHRWVLTRLQTSRELGNEGPVGPEIVWSELTLQAIRAAGAARAKRIHAVVDEESMLLPVLLSTGFTEFAQETVLMAQSVKSMRPANIVRQQDPSDLWAIHQLYHRVTPRPVQYAEAFTSNYWGQMVPGQPAARGYVVEDGLEIIAHCSVTRGFQGPVMHLMVHPDASDLAPLVVRDVLSDIGTNRKHPVSIVISDYAQEYISPMEQIGFVPTGRQTRLVKYTVVARRMQVRGLEELAREVPERVAAGTPTLTFAPSTDTGNKTNEVNVIQKSNGIS